MSTLEAGSKPLTVDHLSTELVIYRTSPGLILSLLSSVNLHLAIPRQQENLIEAPLIRKGAVRAVYRNGTIHRHLEDHLEKISVGLLTQLVQPVSLESQTRELGR